MKFTQWSALACASMLVVVAAQSGQAQRRAKAATVMSLQSKAPTQAYATSGVTLTLATPAVTSVVNEGDSYGVTLSGTWSSPDASPVYLQASDSAGTFLAPPVALAPKLSNYRLVMNLPKATPAAKYTGTFSVRACADSLCANVHPDTTRSIDYVVTVNPVGEWETLQRNARHDGYVPVQIDPTRYRAAWTFERPTDGSLSSVLTWGDNVYFSEPGSTASIRALRASDGAPQWRRVFTGAYSSIALNPPAVSGGVVYATTTGHDDTWLYALRASDGLQTYQSRFFTQWGYILNPTVRNGRAYVNAGYYTGVVYAFNGTDGSAAWEASGGSYGMNTPAVDDDFVYAYNGSTLDVFNAADGTKSTSIGPSPGGVYGDHYATVMLGSPDHVFAFSGNLYGPNANRQLLDYSIADGAIRWMSMSLYSSSPAVAKGIVYATSNETHTFDALDEATGRLLWSWKPPEQYFEFMGNVVATDNVVFVSTTTRIYAISLRYRRTVWSAPTPGTMSIGANRMLYVSSPATSYPYYDRARITGYRMD